MKNKTGLEKFEEWFDGMAQSEQRIKYLKDNFHTVMGEKFKQYKAEEKAEIKELKDKEKKMKYTKIVDDDETIYVSELKVLKSAAGYYVGRDYHEGDKCLMPYCRSSQYFATKELAQKGLDNA